MTAKVWKRVRATARNRALWTMKTAPRGKRADMVVLNANPLEQIRNIRSVRWTIAGGKVYDVQALWKSVRFEP